MADVARDLARDQGFELRDVFDDVCAMLAAGRPFSFSRFGDGELHAIFGSDGANCDGHRYFPDLGQRLRAIVEAKPDYLMGLQPHALLIHRARIPEIAQGIPWVLADSLHDASIDGRLGRLFDALGDRRVVLVGPRHLSPLAAKHRWDHVEIASKDCWTQYGELSRSLAERADPSETVFVFCASMMSSVLIDDLHRVDAAGTHIDAGSVLDPYAGVMSRAYHHELGPLPLLAGTDAPPR